MKTVREAMEDHLDSKGLWPADVDRIIGAIDKQELNEVLDHEIGGFPLVFLVASAMSVESTAARWLAENYPDHIARDLFPNVETRTLPDKA